jgi:cardiolipin synthase
MLSRSNHSVKLITSTEYARDVVRSIDKAKNRIAIVVTTFRDDDPQSQSMVEALCRAGDRGILVSICADIYTYLEPKEFVLRSPKRQPARAYQAIKLERRLKKHGIHFHWLGRTGNIPLAGRTHSKWLIIDNTVYSFGGLNLDRESLSNSDYMLKFLDSSLADHLFNEHSRLLGADRGAHASRSHRFAIGKNSTVLIDGGFFGDSIIYRRAVKRANAAANIVLVSQYCPTGRLNRILRRKKATVYFNHWRKAAWVNKILIQVGMLFARQTTLYTRTPYLHAKFAIFTMQDGNKIAISGSHNFMFGSGFLGTREIALETSDPVIIKQLEHFLREHVQ